MTATKTPSKNTKEASPRRSDAVRRIHLDLDEMVSRLRLEIWIGGTLVVGTVAMASFLAILVIDAFFQPESTWLRVSLWLPLMGVIAPVALRYLAMPLKQECDRLAIAWTLEQRRPAIEERLTTSLQLTETPNGKTSSLIEAVAQQAHGSLAGCQEEDLRGHEVLRRAIVAGACFATFVLSMWIWAPYLIPSLQNVLNPWNTRVLPHLNATIVPGDTHVGEGGDLQVTAATKNLTNVVLEVIENDAVVKSHQMANGTNGTTAEFTLMGVQSDLQYRIRAGGLYSDRYQIYVDPKPIIKSIHLSLMFPEYTQLPPQVINDFAESIEVIPGTRIRIDVDSTLPCAESSLTLGGVSIPCEEPVEDAGLWRHQWEFTATDGELQHGTITLTSEAKVQSEQFPFELRTLPDLPPSIIIDQPVLSEIRATEDHSINVAYHAFDDFGCRTLQLISQKNGEPPSIQEVPRDAATEFAGELTVDLNELDVATGDQLTVWLSISDRRPNEYGGPQIVESRKIRIQITDEADSVGQQVVQNETQTLLDNLTEALDDLKTAKQISRDFQADLANIDAPPRDATERAERLQDQIKDAEKKLRHMSDQGEPAPHNLFQQEIERIQEVADNELAEARKQAGLVPLSDDRPQQQRAIAATTESLNDAIDKLEKVREDIAQRGEQLELAAQLDELARQQERLAQEFDEGKNNAPDVQEKQQQVADELQEIVEQDLDAKSEQFAQRAEKAAELTEKSAELQKQQEALAKLDLVRSQEELNDQLLGMIAREQEQLANETRKLEEQARDGQPLETDVNKSGKPNALAEARKQMEAVPEKLKQKDLVQAEAEARQAGERLQEETKSVPQNGAAQPNANDENKSPRKQDDLKRLAEQQERVRDAIKAVRENRPEEAVAKLQEQIADRTEQLRDKADELLQLPTEDPENQQAVREAREKLEQAEKETKAAEQLTKPLGKPAGEPMQTGEQQKQAGDPMRAGEQQKQAGDPIQAGEQQKQAGDPMQAGEQQKQAGDPMQAGEQQKQAGDPMQAGEQQKQAGDPMQAGEQQKQDGDPKQGGEQQKQAADPMKAGEQQNQAGDPKQANGQQKQAAKSLQEATQSLETVCESCQKCSKCNKPSSSGGSSGGKPKDGGNQTASKDGDQSKKSQPGPKSGESGQSLPKRQKPDSKSLAKTADKAHQQARAPSPQRTQELSEELNQLADQAAQQSGYPNRNSKSNSERSKPSKSSDSSKQDGTQQPGSPSSQPQGVKGNAGANQSEVAPTQLRGRSTSNWTQSRRKLKSNVLDDQDSKIPEEFRGVVKDYFEELSRLESRQETAEDKE